jgi:hypothetical protein
MSRSGLCLKTDTPLRQEQAVTIHPDHLNPSRAAWVRWAMKMESGFYMMGLQYLSSVMAPVCHAPGQLPQFSHSRLSGILF